MKYEDKLKKFEKSMADWTAEELETHMREVEQYYFDTGASTALGDFRWDPQNVYYWHVCHKDSEATLRKRLQLGWRYAPREVASRAGIETNINKANKSGVLDGGTGVVMNHGNAQAILLRMPKELFDINQMIREKAADKKNKGTAVEKIERKGAVQVHTHDDGILHIDDVK